MLVLSRLAAYFLPLLVLGLLIAIWYGLVAVVRVPSYIFPGPDRVLQSLVHRGWGYLPDVWTTAQEILAGFGLALVVGLPLAALISSSNVLRQAIYPILISSQMIPLFVIAAVVTILFQYGLLPQIIVTALYSFFPIVVNGTDGLSGVDGELVSLLRAGGASDWRIFRTIRVPSAMPSIFSGCKLAIIFAVGAAAIGEWIGGQGGLGYVMRFQNGSFDMSGVMATVIVLTTLGVVLFMAVGLIEYIALPWHRRSGQDLGNLWRG